MVPQEKTSTKSLTRNLFKIDIDLRIYTPVLKINDWVVYTAITLSYITKNTDAISVFKIKHKLYKGFLFHSTALEKNNFDQ